MNRNKLGEILIAILILCLVAAIVAIVIENNQYKRKANENEKAIQKRFRERELEYDAALRYSEVKRQHLEHTNDSLTVVLGNLHRLDSINGAEILKLRGKYSKMNASELTRELIKQYEEGKAE